MKKKVKALIIATSVAAIAGIGAVSFAAWDAGANKSATATGAAGSTISTIGDIKLAYNDGTASDALTIDKKLVPYDQATSKAVLDDADNTVNYWKLTVTNSATTQTNVEYYIKLNAELTNNTAAEGDTAATLYWTKATSYTAPDASLTGWNAISTDATGNGAILTGVAHNDSIIVILAATKAYAQGSDIALTVTAVQGEAA